MNNGGVPVDPANTGAFEAWNGDEGTYWAENADRFEATAAGYRDAFFEAAGITSDDVVLDIRCGSGATTREAARRASGGSALGIDLSSPMLELAARRAGDEGVDNVAFVHGDAQVYPFASDEFSVAISRSGAMFFADPVAAFTNIGRALRADGRLMLMVWQSIDRNHWIRDLSAILTAGRDVPAPPPGAPGPLSLADPDRVDALLSASGFHDIALADVAAPVCLGATADDAFRFVSGMGFVQFMLKDLDDRARARALDELRANVDAHASAEGVCYDSAAWLVSARRG
jgi:SAM-dependent methyltransferase